MHHRFASIPFLLLNFVKNLKTLKGGNVKIGLGEKKHKKVGFPIKIGKVASLLFTVPITQEKLDCVLEKLKESDQFLKYKPF